MYGYKVPPVIIIANTVSEYNTVVTPPERRVAAFVKRIKEVYIFYQAVIAVAS